MKRNSGRSLPHIATRIFDTPLLIHPQKLETILAVLGSRIGLTRGAVAYDDYDEQTTEVKAGPTVTGVAIIPVHGTLVKRGTGMDAMSGLTSYEELQSMVAAAMADDQCRALLFDIDSPGGEAAGLFDFCKYLSSVSGTKPMVGISNDAAYSAAYCIASCMDKLLVTEVGGVGSIGVYTLHVDRSGYDAEMGLKYTYIHAGAKKVDGNPHEPLADSVLAEFQTHVDKIRDMFVGAVAANRHVSAKSLYDTEAGTFMGHDGVPLLADGVGTFEDALMLACDMAEIENRTIVLPPAEAEKTRGSEHLTAAMDTLRRSYATNTVPSKHFEFILDSRLGEMGELLTMRQFGTVQLNPSASSRKNEMGSISGILAPYNRESCDLGGFREIYQPGCFTKFLKSGDDALVLGFHNPENVLGRLSNQTAAFWDEADGLHYSADLPDTQFARDLKALIERGDVRGSSAAFYITKHRWETRSGERVRIVEEASLVEGSPHSLVAYEQSTATVAPAEEKVAANNFELDRARLNLLR